MDKPVATNFIRKIIEKDIAAGKNDGKVATRFPPEPNGFLHVGHAKAICISFGMAEEFGGTCNLRFDDTNPAKESEEYVDAIKADIHWLGFQWQGEPRFASNYFEFLYACAIQLIEKGLAYVDSQEPDAIREQRGTLTETGTNSPYRDRSVAENLDLFQRMRAGEFADGAHVLRAKIDMLSPNINMRDPLIYRIRHVHHHNTGDQWCIYPLYDFTHGLSDAHEGITHSLCSLEFEDHRPLYDWFLDQIDGLPARPRQYEFSRLNLKYTVTSKRKLSQLVEEGHVAGWDDPRMPTISGMRRRGFPPEAIRDFIARTGVTKKVHTAEMGVLENSVRESLDATAVRRMAVLDPLKVVITNVPVDKVEMVSLPNHPKFPEMGSREMPFTREVYIERSDFMEDAPRKFFRLKPDGAVRLRGAYVIDCHDVIKDDDGNVVELHCTLDPDTRSGTGTSDRKIKGTIHWVSASHGKPATIRLYDRLFTRGNPDAKDGEGFLAYLNPDSLVTMDSAMVEPALAELAPEERAQFERTGYFCADRHEHSDKGLVFNRAVTLRDTWAKLEQADRDD